MKLTRKIVFDTLTDLDIFYMPYSKRSEDELWKAADQWFEDLEKMDVKSFKRCVSSARKKNDHMITTKHVLSEYQADNMRIEWKPEEPSGPRATAGWVAGLLDALGIKEAKPEPKIRKKSAFCRIDAGSTFGAIPGVADRSQYVGTQDYQDGYAAGLKQIDKGV